MFDIEKYYELAHSGEKLTEQENSELLEYIKSYKHVVLWGGSFLGRAVGKFLIEQGVNIENYWDIRHEELKDVNGIDVIAPYSTQDKENTLVIVCIANNVIISNLLNKLKLENYNNVIRGEFLYEGAICPFDKSTGINAKRCSRTMECRQVYCKRVGNIVKGNNIDNTKPRIDLTSVTLVINSVCSLKCKFCTSYMNEYPVDKRKNIPFERISKDIDAFFDTVDSVGTITVMGGEPFLHPDLSKIIEKLCEKKNFGLISIATSGTAPINDEQIKGLYDKRVNVSFSNYSNSISEKQKEMYYKNIEKLDKAGVCYTAGLFSPEWIIPSTLYKKNCDESAKIKRRSTCINYYQIKNGKVFPCDFATAINNLGIADYKSDYIDLTEEISTEERKKIMIDYLNRPYYESCAHHIRGAEDNIKGVGMTEKAAVQGYIDFKKPLSESINNEVSY